jgi:hypothetical protein
VRQLGRKRDNLIDKKDAERVIPFPRLSPTPTFRCP